MSVCMCSYVPCTASVSSRHAPGPRLRHSGQLQGASRHSFSVLPLTGRSRGCRQVQVQAAGVHNLGAGGVGGGRCGARIAEERPKLLGVRGRNERGFLRCRAESDDGSSRGRAGSALEDPPGTELQSQDQEDEEVIPENSLSKWLYPPAEELPDEKEMTIFDHLEELRDRLLISVAAVGVAMGGCFFFAKDLIVILEKPVYSLGVRFLALSPGEYFFTTLKVSGYCGLLLGSPIILYELIAFVIPGLTRSERRFLGPIVLGSSVLFYTGLGFSYAILTPAALSFFVSYAEGVVESLWSIDQYFEFVLVLMFSTGLAFQVPVIQLLLGQTRLVNGDQMLSVWRYVVVGAVIAAAVLTPSTDPLTQCLLAGPLIGLYMGGAFLVKFLIPETDALEG